jgi:tetratricopeptide (TPR) repeat protein
MSQKQKLQTRKQGKMNTHWVSIFVIIGIVLAVYAQSVTFNFSYFDDHTILLENKEFFTAGFSFKNTFTTSAFIGDALLYRPLQNLSFAWDAKISGGVVPWAFHLTNLILFALIGFSLYLLLLKLNITSPFALLGTLLYLANPLNVWSVVWIPARGDLFLTLFTLLSFICFIDFMKTDRFIAMILTFLCFSFALFAKETAAIIPFLFLFYFFVIKKSKITYKYFLLAGLMLGIGVVWFWLRTMAITQIYEIYSFKSVIRNFINIPVALSQIFFPYEMSPFPKFTLPKIILGSIVCVLLLYFTIKKAGTSSRENQFFLLWFFLFLLPSFYAEFLHMDYFEHRYLLPQIGILLFVMKQLSVRMANIKSQIPRYLIIFFILPIFGITSFLKAQTLKNPDTLLKATVKYDGFTLLPYLDRGGYFTDLGKYAKATQDFEKVLQLDPNNYEAFINLAKIYLLQENYENANMFYTFALSLMNTDYRIYENRSQAKIGMGDLQGALLDIDSALMMKKDQFLLYNNRGVLKMNLGLFEDALPDFEEAKKLSNASNTDVLYNCAVVKYKFDDYIGALPDCNLALQLEPNNADVSRLREQILMFLP